MPRRPALPRSRMPFHRTTARGGPAVRRTHAVVLSTTAAIAGVMLAACGPSGTQALPTAITTSRSATAAPASPATPGGTRDLAEVCPAVVVMQTDWQPQAEHGGMYELLGGDYTIDTNAKSVRGPLLAAGEHTGVEVEIRTGGVSVGFQRVAPLMYLDPEILIGMVNTDQAIAAAAADMPVVAVASQLTWSPQMLMWDPATYPEASSAAEAAEAGAPVVVAGATLAGLLEAQGVIGPGQADTSYEGTPQRFVADPTILTQGFGTAEPYIYAHEIAPWARPVAFQYLHEVGYSIYPQPISVRAADLAEQADCLARLVPILQRSQIDYLTSPARTNALIVELVEEYDAAWTYSLGVAEFSAAGQLADGLVTNDPASGVFGQLDPERIAEIVATFAPVMVEAGVMDPAEVDPEALYTNRFLDPTISLPDPGGA